MRGARIAIPAGLTVAHSGQPDDAFTARDLLESLAERRISVDTSPSAGRYRVELIRLGTPRALQLLRERRMVYDSAMTAEGYLLLADTNGVRIIGASARGIFYGAQTLKQLITGTGRAAVLQAASIRDWPAMKYRGFHDDLSRGPVPTLAYQKT